MSHAARKKADCGPMIKAVAYLQAPASSSANERYKGDGSAVLYQLQVNGGWTCLAFKRFPAVLANKALRQQIRLSLCRL
jgi:hypothetical protein